MPTPYDEQPDLDLVADYLAVRGLSAERYLLAETQSGKTPDFRVRRNGDIVAYCEVKSPHDPWLDDLLHDAPSQTIVGGARSDPIFNRLARLLNKADAQFAAVNPSQREINILAYVNHDAATRYSDLYETLTGTFLTVNGRTFSTVRHIAEDWIGEAKRRIDVFLWFEGATRFMRGALINDADSERMRLACAVLGFDRNEIK